MMALSIGIDCSASHWRICIREYGHILHLRSFANISAALSYLENICALYPEPTIALPLGRATSLARLSTIVDQQMHVIISWLNNQKPQEDLEKILKAIQSLSLDSYCLPAIKHLPTVSKHRKLNPMDMGTPDSLCTIATLMYRLSERETAWSEMNFLCVLVGYTSRSIVVLEHGRIVNGISQGEVTDYDDAEVFVGSRVEDSGNGPEEAFWEELTRDLAGLMAIHHLEDIIVIGQRENAFVERFAEIYQVYYFPHGEAGTDDYEIAIGAAIIAEGLRNSGLAREVVERLQIR